MIRALHFVFKIGDRGRTAEFYRNVLGMRFLRHEEFTEGCAAFCNGPYQGRWSKSMVGYGPEDEHFVLELTYNYGVGRYAAGNDFSGIVIRSTPEAIERARKSGWPLTELQQQQSTPASGGVAVESPDGHRFELVPGGRAEAGDPSVVCVRLASSNLDATVAYWRDLLGFFLLESNSTTAVLAPGASQCRLEFRQLTPAGTAVVEHAKAYGRVAFACPASALPSIQAACEAAGRTVLKPLVSLDTPGKATVQVVILADPDGHEICFVGDEAFRELSRLDESADRLLDEAMAGDKSNEWFAKRGGKMEEA